MNRDAEVQSVPAFRQTLTEKTSVRQPGFFAKRAGQKLGRHSEGWKLLDCPNMGRKWN